MKQEFPSKKEFLRWLKSSVSAVFLTISVTSGLQEFRVQASSAKTLSKITQATPDYFGEGAYIVEYEETDNEENKELTYTNIVTAITFKGYLAHHPEIDIGGLDSLREYLSGYEYTAKVNREQAGFLGQLLIVIPKNLEEIENLKEILHNLSIAYIFPDETGTINQNNLKMGNGLWA